MKKIFKYLLFLAPSIILSQEKLSLEDALKIGLKQNFEIQLAKKNLEINKLNNNYANAGALPSINISTVLEASFRLKPRQLEILFNAPSLLEFLKISKFL